MSKKPTVLMILDGYGLNSNCEHNAVCEAKTPVMDQLMSQCPYVRGNASGLAVGLPDGQMGNSEVGHLNMGAGRIVYQELTRITKSIEDGDFFTVPEFLEAVENCKKNNSALHLFGLVSDGGVHSHNTHIYGLLELAKRNGLTDVYVHCFLDGRDTPPASGKDFVAGLEAKMKEIGVGRVASVMGRYYAMDRDKNWDRVKRAYDVLTRGEGEKADTATGGIQASYDREINDEFVVPFNVEENGRPVAVIQDEDSVIFFNGGIEEPNAGEDRILVPSPKEVPTYDLKPEMSAPQVCDKLVEAIKSDKYDVIVINFANPDMVGHTGVEDAAIKAIETVDACVGRTVEAIKETGGVLFICADHGNAEQLVDYETGEPWTAHTTNQVPFILVNADPSYKLREGGCLADIAPTLIELMGMEQPKEMTGKSLLVK